VRKILGLIYFITTSFIKKLRYSQFASDIRASSLRYRGAKIGKNNTIQPNIKFSQPKNLIIGDNNFFGEGCSFYSIGSEIRIGSNNLVASRCCFITRNHLYKDAHKLIKDQGYSYGSIELGSNIWLGFDVQVCAGVTIEDGAVLGAKSLVTSRIPTNSLAVGIPARVVKSTRM